MTSDGNGTPTKADFRAARRDGTGASFVRLGVNWTRHLYIGTCTR